MLAVIPGLRQSPLHQISADLYHRHDDSGHRRCACCGRPTPCPARQHAATVLLAAGDDPRRHDQHGQPHASTSDPMGYPLGGRGGRLPPEGFTYERDPES